MSFTVPYICVADVAHRAIHLRPAQGFRVQGSGSRVGGGGADLVLGKLQRCEITHSLGGCANP